MSDCVICQGGGYVRLPVYRKTSYTLSPEVLMGALTVEENARTYQCPECRSAQAAQERVHIVYAEEIVRDAHRYRENSGVDEHVARQLATATARKFLQDGLIEIRKEKRGDDIVYRSRIGAVSPRMVATLEQRAIDRMKEFLIGVRETAAAAISVWGSAYTGNEGVISKGQAIDFMNAAFDRHLSDAGRCALSEGDRHAD